MIESGTLVPGISAQDFQLPPGTALRYERPDPALAHLFSSYAVLDSVEIDPPRPRAWQLPSWGQIWIILTDEAVTMQIGNRSYDLFGTTVLMGVTSHAQPTTARGGVSIVISLSPLGWARLFGPTAEAHRDRITPLARLLPEPWTRDLVNRLHASDRGRDVKAILDDFLLTHLPPPHRDEPLIARILPLLNSEGSDLAHAARTIGIDVRTLRNLTKRYFGFPPKLLQIRARFLSMLVELMLGDRALGAPLPSFYHDASHFLRDAQRFLGTTPRRFLKEYLDYTTAALRARKLVIGSPLPVFDPAPTIADDVSASRRTRGNMEMSA